MEAIWTNLYQAAQQVLNPRDVSDLITAGGVAAAIEATSGVIYVGVCVDTACSLGVCAERNAIFNLLTHGENQVKRILAIDHNGQAMPPCGTCRELLVQLMPQDYQTIQVMLDHQRAKIMTLGELTPDWWV